MAVDGTAYVMIDGLRCFHVRGVYRFDHVELSLLRHPSGKLGSREARSSAIDRDASMRWHDETSGVG